MNILIVIIIYCYGCKAWLPICFASGYSLFEDIVVSLRPGLTNRHMNGGQNYLLPTMDMAKVGGPLSVVKVCTSILCVKIGYR